MTHRKPVIAHVLHRLYLAGAEVLAAALARRLRDEYDFVFLCLDEVGPLGEELAREGFAVESLDRRPGIDLKVSRRIRRAVRAHGVDLLHAHQYAPFFYAAASRRLGRTPKVLFTEHGRTYPDYRRWKRVWANRFLLKRTDHVTAVGHFIKQALIDHEGIAGSRIEVIHNGIDPARFALPAEQRASARAAIRQSLGLSDDVPVVAQVARFHPVKDHATAVRAMAMVTQAVPNAVLLLVGDGERRPEIESLCRELAVGEHVRVLGVRSDIPELMAAADVFVLSSLSEGISVTLLEAMGASVPICATDVGGNGEVVADGESGLLSPRADAQALASNLTTLLTDRALRQRMGDVGRERLLAHFSESAMHEAYDRAYRELLLPTRKS